MVRLKIILVIFCLNLLFPLSREADAQSSSCSKLPRGIAVVSSAKVCGGAPAVAFTGTWRGVFSAAFRWINGATLEDRSPYALENGSAASSPYKAQRKIRYTDGEVLCYGNFVKDTRFPLPVQLTVKRTAAPLLNRFCINFSR